MNKHTKPTLHKIEQIFKELDYLVRYEKGTFNSGYCIVENTKIVVVNKFFDTEARINALIDILSQVEINLSLLDEKQLRLYEQLAQQKLELE